ncbi:MAG: hypothetical protein AAGG81_02885 [Chlamydiota bacterium]
MLRLAGTSFFTNTKTLFLPALSVTSLLHNNRQRSILSASGSIFFDNHSQQSSHIISAPRFKTSLQNRAFSQVTVGSDQSKISKSSSWLLLSLLGIGSIGYYMKEVDHEKHREEDQSILNGSCNRSTSSLPSILIEKYKENLLTFLKEEDFCRVRELLPNTFDVNIWRKLNSAGPTNYHWSIVNELEPGYLWLQEDDEKKVEVLWVTEPGHIHKANLVDGECWNVESFMSHVLNQSDKIHKFTLPEFSDIIRTYLEKNSRPKETMQRSLKGREFQKQLELLPIIVSLSRSALKEFRSIAEKHSVYDMEVIIGIDAKEEKENKSDRKEFTPLIWVSKYFLNGRIYSADRISHEPDVVTEPVAPVLASIEAYEQAKQLRQDDGDGYYQLQVERQVASIVSKKNGKPYQILDQNIEDIDLKDLRAKFVLTPGGIVSENYDFKVEMSKNSDSTENSMRLSIDFKNGKWMLVHST